MPMSVSIPPENGRVDSPEDLFDVAHGVYRPDRPAVLAEVVEDRLGLRQIIALPKTDRRLGVVLALDEVPAAAVAGPGDLGWPAAQVVTGLTALTDATARESLDQRLGRRVQDDDGLDRRLRPSQDVIQSLGLSDRPR